MSAMKKRYIARLVGRCLVFILCLILYFVYPRGFDVLDGMNFFREFSPLHLLWLLWFIDMAVQIVPIKSKIALGSKKLFAKHFRQSGKAVSPDILRTYIRSANKSALVVMLLWILLIAFIGVLYFTDILSRADLFMVSASFYIYDLICVLIWCPFRLIMKTRCCTTCRIFNWDHFMMFSPMIFLVGFYSMSLVVLSVVALFLWELSILLHPERFYEKTNEALKCSECTDKLCHRCKKRK